MTRRFLLLAALAVAACASPAPPQPALGPGPAASADRDAILGVIDRFLLGVGNGDAAAQRAEQIAEGYTYLTRLEPRSDGPAAPDPRVVVRSNTQMLEQVAADPFIERYWDPVVQVRGPLAQVWAPYALHDNGELVHCGINAFQLVKQAGAWKIGSSMSTMEPGSCEDLSPPPRSAMRPLAGWRETPLQ